MLLVDTVHQDHQMAKECALAGVDMSADHDVDMVLALLQHLFFARSACLLHVVVDFGV